MKVLFFRTHTPDCDKLWLSCEAAGHTVSCITYDDRPHSRQDEFIAMAREWDPKAIVFIGAIEKFHTRPVMTPDTLKKLRGVAPTIHLCSDGGERVWWEWLNLYEVHGCFDAQVSIDGVTDCPISRFKHGIVLLTPCDPRVFQPKPWGERTRTAGMLGTMQHGERAQLMYILHHRLGMPLRDREGGYAEMAAWLADTKLIVNHPMNGSGTGVHCKGRVLESGWAGACLLERKNEVTAGWFADNEYVAYTDYEDCIRKIQWLRDNDAEARGYAERLHAAVSTKHHPARFWEHVFQLANTRDMVS